MARELKVYGWTNFAKYEGKFVQCRFVTAAHSVAEVLRQADITRSAYAFQGGETGNDEEVQVATGYIGGVFYRSLNVREGGWVEQVDA